MEGRGYIPCLAKDTDGGDAVGGMISLDMSLEIVLPLEHTTTIKESE
jgi:hypothetical protein